MAAKIPAFREEEMAIDEMVGYPKAYAKLCRSGFNPYIQGPPLTFVPYALQPQEAFRAKDLNQMFHVIDPEAKPSANPRGFVNLLWKQLDHLGNAGFDPGLFRVDPFGNVLYLHADSASPLAWDIDHWFPCSKGGRTVPSNLRLLQWQVCKKKKNKLDFLIPWWDFQLGISVNQFLSIFASRNSDFRNRAFSFLFSDGGSEELNALQAVESHSFPQHFIEMKRQVGLAPAAIVSLQRSSEASVLKPLDINRSLRHNSALTAIRKFSAEEDDALNMATQRFRPTITKENEQPETDDYNSNPYLSITRARDSLRLREESKKKQAEINCLEEELNELKQKNETERLALQELEAVLIKRRRRVEKCRRLAEAQSSYRALLEKMIRDAMHQSVVYKEQVRLNQAATSALMARLEAQRAICDTSENELRRKFKQRDEIEKQIRPCREEQARKRSRMDDTMFEERHKGIMRSRMDDTMFEERHEGTMRAWNPLKKELRLFLEEEQKASESGLSHGEEEEETAENTIDAEKDKKCKAMILTNNDISYNDKKRATFREGHGCKTIEPKKKNSFLQSNQEEDEEHEIKVAAKDEISLNYKLKGLAIKEGCCSRTNEEEQEGFSTFVNSKNELSTDDKLEELGIREGNCSKTKESERPSPFLRSPHEEDEEYKNQVGKGNVEKWLQMMLENAKEGSSSSTDSPPRNSNRPEDSTAEIVHKLNLVNPQKEIKYLRLKPLEEKSGSELKPHKQQTKESCSEVRRTVATEMRSSIGVGSSSACKGVGSRQSFEVKEREDSKGGIASCESSRGFRSFPSSPSVILGMRRGVDCMGKKPKVMGDDDDEGYSDLVATNSNKFIRTCTKTFKKAANK